MTEIEVKVGTETYSASIRAIGGETYCNNCLAELSAFMVEWADLGLSGVPNQCFVEQQDENPDKENADQMLDESNIENIDEEVLNLTPEDVSSYFGKSDITRSPLASTVRYLFFDVS